ncbi:MAG: tRNA (adenosine(37)-N6)-threonylcarbamoyltransferase complex dimerization subunit type 1 TsaB [Candidatus Acetothermia bacterium]|jgi:tRNA threonylcarbamoyladenosine biosynthesis protein TsaB|nr:tRNA (adenosine(37)-N6)-threonylcarbamoyltransferase complex dimerization subunit type 1 TsaB [Candidatus Acetothermia bacterium]MDH7504870.1 tRNA (adenosine(37)-N6)-threonylcarbamoyltransferase complex dimerization subunit type 1 TsaB [Candidatus Acetothermia bacterium]
MLTLGIDTATEIGSVGLADGPAAIGELTFPARMGQAERLLQAVDRLLELSRLQVEALELIAVSSGPGSFTGLRIGIATAKGLAQGLGIPLVGVPTPESYARRVKFCPGRVCVLIHDRRNLVYVAEFAPGSVGQSAAEERVEEIEAVLAEALTGRLFLGSGAERYRGELVARGGTVAPQALNLPSGLEVALLGAEKFAKAKKDELFSLEPRYLQRPLAELRVKSEREGVIAG